MIDSLNIQEIPNEDFVARLVIHPHMFRNNEFIWSGGLFEFQSRDGYCDSVVWRKYVDDAGVHALGAIKVATKENQKYEGFLNGYVEKIRSVETNRSIKCEVSHDPSNNQGIHHAEIKIITPNETKLTKNDRRDVIEALKTIFLDWFPV